MIDNRIAEKVSMVYKAFDSLEDEMRSIPTITRQDAFKMRQVRHMIEEKFFHILAIPVE